MIPISYWMIVQLTFCFPCKRCCCCCTVTVHVGINGFCFYWKTTYANIETDVGNIHLLEKQKNHSKGMMVGVCIILLFHTNSLLDSLWNLHFKRVYVPTFFPSNRWSFDLNKRTVILVFSLYSISIVHTESTPPLMSSKMLFKMHAPIICLSI